MFDHMMHNAPLFVLGTCFGFCFFAWMEYVCSSKYSMTSLFDKKSKSKYSHYHIALEHSPRVNY